MNQSPYAYVLEIQTMPGHYATAVFTWPNPAKKYIRDMYSLDGELHLPPPGHLILKRYKVNPKSTRIPGCDMLDVEKFVEL